MNGVSQICLNTISFLQRSESAIATPSIPQKSKARDNNALETDYHVRFEIDWIGMDSACFLRCNDDKLQSEILASERSCESKF